LTATLGDKGLERQFEAVLAAIGSDRPGRIASAHQGRYALTTDTFGPRFLREGLFPDSKPCRPISAGGRMTRACARHKSQDKEAKGSKRFLAHIGIRLPSGLKLARYRK
jgi:hypothetical protein